MGLDEGITDLKEVLLQEIQQLRHELQTGMAEVHSRLDKQDLNHAAEYLRDFGYFLERNPKFMRRQVENEMKRQEREVVVRFFQRVLHLNNLKQKISWMIVGVAGGLLFAIGNAAYSPLAPLAHWTLHLLSGK